MCSVCVCVSSSYSYSSSSYGVIVLCFFAVRFIDIKKINHNYTIIILASLVVYNMRYTLYETAAAASEPCEPHGVDLRLLRSIERLKR